MATLETLRTNDSIAYFVNEHSKHMRSTKKQFIHDYLRVYVMNVYRQIQAMRENRFLSNNIPFRHVQMSLLEQCGDQLQKTSECKCRNFNVY